MQQCLPRVGGGDRPRWASRRTLWLFLSVAIAALLVLLMLAELPVIADWSFFSFYDPGAVLKGDELISLGMKPAIDFGYTHGLASLALAHWGFVLLGRTPAAFLIMMGILKLFMALAIARFAMAMRFRGWAIAFLLCALPVAIMPCYLTLTHPLEALLLLWAIAEEAAGRREWSLACCTACLFVKPSMAYMYGLVLVLWTLWDWRRRGAGWLYLLRRTRPAIATGTIMATVMTWWFGLKSLLLTIVPLTGLRTYQDTHFGFFRNSGLKFWSPLRHSFVYYLVTPAGLWLLCMALLIWFGAGLIRQLRLGMPHRGAETLISIAVMQVTFVLGFYGWTNSWQYYSYLPVLFVAVLLIPPRLCRPGWRRGANFSGEPGNADIPVHKDQGRRKRYPAECHPNSGDCTTPKNPHTHWRWAMALCLLALLSQAKYATTAINGWQTKVRSRQTGGLWAYPRQLAEWRHVTAMISGRPALALFNGYLPWMPPGMIMPLSWFPEPGIPTPIELARVKRQLAGVDYVLTCNEYGRLGLWNQKDFAAVRRRFRRIWRGNWMSVWKRRRNFIFPRHPPDPLAVRLLSCSPTGVRGL